MKITYYRKFTSVSSGSFMTPSGYNLMTVVMFGAKGGSGGGYSGGFGARVQATFSISPTASTLYYSVGGRGGDDVGGLALGGFNGGNFSSVVFCL
jgi:hypothetical protein